MPTYRSQTTTVARSDRGFDIPIVGAGSAESVLAERLATRSGKRMLLVDQRPHIGGNAYDRYDRYDDAGIFIHQYGPLIFQTNSSDVFDDLAQFTAWRSYQHRVLASVDGQLLPMPINPDTVNSLYGLSMTSRGILRLCGREGRYGAHLGRRGGRQGRARSLQQVLSWLHPQAVGAQSVRAGRQREGARVDPVQPRRPLFHRHLPGDAAARLHAHVETMLKLPNIHVVLNTDYRDVVHHVPWKHVVYTGPVDAFFDCRYRRLPYRSLMFKHVTLLQSQSQAQPLGTPNHPNDHAYTHASEFKHLTGQQHPSTSLVYEYPQAQGDPYYPVPRPENSALYKRYEAEAEQLSDVTFLGGLANDRYCNMDQVVGQTLVAHKRMAAVGATSSLPLQSVGRSRVKIMRRLFPISR